MDYKGIQCDTIMHRLSQSLRQNDIDLDIHPILVAISTSDQLHESWESERRVRQRAILNPVPQRPWLRRV